MRFDSDKHFGFNQHFGFGRIVRGSPLMLRSTCLVLMLLSCGAPDASPDPRSIGPLVNVFDWAVTEPDEDPFAELWSDQVRCPDSEHGPEDLAGVWSYSIQTGACNWLTIEHPTLLAVRAGDRVRAEVWHFTLSAPEPASARVGLATADGILVQTMEPIPQPGRLMELEFIAQAPIAEATPLYFHISNHGANSWHLLNIELNPVVEERGP